jgi:hypothetical protein
MTKNEISQANRALYLAARGTEAQLNAFEDNAGAGLAAILDELWEVAEEAGDKAMACRLASAYKRLTEW